VIRASQQGDPSGLDVPDAGRNPEHAVSALDEILPGSGLAEHVNAWLDPLDPWIQAAVVLLVGVLLAKLADVVLVRLLRLAMKRTKSIVDDQVLSHLHGPVTRTLTLAALALAGRVLGLEEGQWNLLHHTILTLLVLIWTVFLSRTARLVLDAASRTPDRFKLIQPPTYPLFENAAKLLFLFFALYLLIEIWGVDATGWLASAGIVGLALGFAAQDTLANLFAGVFILADRPYKVGDYIVLDSGERGRVVHIGLRSTRLLTRDDVEITIPNRVMGEAKIVNESGGPYTKYRLKVPVGVAYGSDLAVVRGVLLAAAAASPYAERVPEPRTRFRAFGDSSLDFELLVWVSDPAQRGLALDDLLERIYLGFAEAGVEIPFPQRDLHVRTLPPDFGGGVNA